MQNIEVSYHDEGDEGDEDDEGYDNNQIFDDDETKAVDDGDAKLFTCDRCKKSWLIPSNSRPDACKNCIDSTLYESESLDSSPSLNILVAACNKIDETSLKSLNPPNIFSVESNHYYVSTSSIRGDFDKSRSKYFALMIESGIRAPDGLKMIAKISDTYNDINKANLSSKI